MSKKIVRVLFIISFVLMNLAHATAQDGANNSYTPYSVFGIGDIYKEGSAYNKTMGGVGIAARNKRFINTMNPAAITARDTLSFMLDFGLSNTNKVYSQGGFKSANNTLNISGFSFSFPVYKSLSAIVGVAPFSDVGYDFSSSIKDPDIIANTGHISYTSSGTGGLYQLYGGLAFTLWDKLNIGAEALYYFGNINKSSSMVFSDASYRSSVSGYKMELNAFTGKVGVQYDQYLGNEMTLTAGATYRMGTKLKGYVRDYKIATISSMSDTLKFVNDTLGKTIANPKIANEFGIGLALKKGDKWSVEVDYIYSDWSSSRFASTSGFANAGSTVFSATSSHSLRAGFELTPNRNDIRYYMRRCTYRGGVYYDKSYFKLDGKSVDAFGLTFGVTLPVFRYYNGITVGADIGQRGTVKGNLTRERYVGFFVGFNIHDIWFVKPRYD